MPYRTAPELSRSSSTPVSARNGLERSPPPAGERESRTGNDPGFAVYVHWPFCQAKCPYCDFNSHVRPGGVDERAYLDAYLAELDHMAALTGPRAVRSVFFGGGTPSLMGAETAAAILERIARNWRLETDAEVTLEANPTSVEAERFAGYRAAGVNRVSLGVQALNDADLKTLGRLHTAEEALRALETGRAHFDRVSLDLIYARPGQTAAQWRAELERTLSLAPGHLSLYQLTIEPGTPFGALHAAGKLEVPDDEAAGDLYAVTQDACAAAGLPPYEVSNHARPGQECRHNLVYWRYGEYAGVGPGAHGRLDVGGVRHALATVKAPEDWAERVAVRGHGLDSDEPLSAAEQAEEYLLMGLRLSEGLDLDRYAALGGALDEETIGVLESEGLVARTGSRLAATPQCRMVLNAVIAELA